MLRKHRGFLIFLTTCVVLGAGLRLIWDAATDRTDPPIWVSLLVAVAVSLTALRVESWDDRRRARRQRDQVQGPRPTNPDGTPYGYHQIREGGWSHCDGCRMWGQGWTPENPHQCQQTYTKGPASQETTR